MVLLATKKKKNFKKKWAGPRWMQNVIDEDKHL